MNKQLEIYLDDVFAPYTNLAAVQELKEELGKDLQEHVEDLKAQGFDDEAALAKAIESIGDIDETIAEVAAHARVEQSNTITNYSETNLPKADLKNVSILNGNFNASMLKETDFSSSDLAGTTFKGSDMRGVCFDNSNLTDARLIASALSETSFRNSNLTGADLSKSDLTGAHFENTNLTRTTFKQTALSQATFINCTFEGTDFGSSDLSKMSFDNQVLTSVSFDKAGINGATFRNATLINVSFRRKTKRSLNKVVFENTKMDKLTYAILQGIGVDVSNIQVI